MLLHWQDVEEFTEGYWRITIKARYMHSWWHGIYSKEGCQLANTVGHEAHQTMEALDFGDPFDVIDMDVWIPGEATDKCKVPLALQDEIPLWLLPCWQLPARQSGSCARSRETQSNLVCLLKTRSHYHQKR